MKRYNLEQSLLGATLAIFGLLYFAQIEQITCVQLGRLTLTRRTNPLEAIKDSAVSRAGPRQDRSTTNNICFQNENPKMPLAHIRTSPPSQELKSYTAIPSTTSKSEQNNSGEMENILESSLEETSEDESLGRAEKTVKSVRDGHEKLIKEGDHLSNLWSDSADVIPPKRLPVVHSGSIIDTFRTALKSIDLNECEANGENAFYVCDLATVYRLYLRWQKTMGGRVKPFFAVKCNPDPHILNLFAKLGLGFDCASHAEIAQVLAMGVSPSDIIYANPCKAGSFIRYAHASGVDMMTFDNLDELHKVAKHHPSAKMVMRILIDDRESLCRFGEKFGAPLANIDLLLDTARKLGVNVIGVAFHVGSGCINPELYKDAVKHAKGVFELASQYGYKFNLLDVGGGFGDNNLEELSKGLLAGLDEHFPTGCGVTVIAEPGRYFVTEAFELATNIIARRQASSTKLVPGAPMTAPTSSEEEDATLYYINDGVYGTFNCIMFDHQVVYPKILTLDGKFYPEGPRQGIETALDRPHTPAVLEDSTPASGTSLSSVSSAIIPSENESNGVSRSTNLELHPCKIFGPSCDSIDLVCPRTHLPTKNLKVGDWLSWPRMGAYTICAASEFNGFKISRVKYTIDARGDAKLEHELRLIIGQ